MTGFVFSRGSWRIRAAGTRVRVAVALTDDAVGRIQQVAASCRALGFNHDSTLRGIGVLTGSVDVQHLARLRDVPGVLVVETRREWRSRWSRRFA